MCCPGLQGDGCSGRGRGTANPGHYPVAQGPLNMLPLGSRSLAASAPRHRACQDARSRPCVIAFDSHKHPEN